MSSRPESPLAKPADRLLARSLRPIAISLALVAGTTALLWFIEAKLKQEHLIFIYFAPAAWIAIRYGSVSAMCVTIASSLSAAYFLYPPHLSFLIDSPRDILELVLFGMLALLASRVVSGFANDSEVERRRRKPSSGGSRLLALAGRFRNIRP